MAGFKNLEDLVGDLGEGLRKLRAGKLEPEELTPLVADARELCDRLTLLRFKAHEFSYEVRRKGPQGGIDERVAERQPVRPFRIGAAYQTSLIDAIEEVSREQVEQAEAERREAGTPGLFDAPINDDDTPAAETFQEEVLEEVLEDVLTEAEAPTDSEEVKEALEPTPADTPAETEEDPEPDMQQTPEPVLDSSEAEVVPEAGSAAQEPLLAAQEGAPSLAEQLERQPIASLKTAFSLVEKYECIKMLFADDAGEFNRVLEALDEAATFELAEHWLNQQVPASSGWDPEDPVVMRFMDRVERRFA
jgi:hypothetical protein